MPYLLVALLILPQQMESQNKHPAIGDPASIAAGKILFLESCAVCHGPEGQGGRGPNLRQQVMWHTLTDDETFLIIEKGVPQAGMPAAELAPEQIWQVVAYIRWLVAPAFEAPPSGSVAAGSALFWGKGGCSKCHQILGRGGFLGPDLSDVGARRSVGQIREAVTDPDADGFRGYRGVTAVLKSGRTLKGIARNRTNYSIQIIDEHGNLHLLAVGDVKSLTLSEHSPMPDDYARRLTGQEINDLVAFLSHQSVRPYAPSEKKR